MVNGVPREVPRPKHEGLQAPRVVGLLPPRLFHISLVKCSPRPGGHHGLSLEYWRTLQKWAKFSFSNLLGYMKL